MVWHPGQAHLVVCFTSELALLAVTGWCRACVFLERLGKSQIGLIANSIGDLVHGQAAAAQQLLASLYA